jgi:hypothetical protein
LGDDRPEVASKVLAGDPSPIPKCPTTEVGDVQRTERGD